MKKNYANLLSACLLTICSFIVITYFDYHCAKAEERKVQTSQRESLKAYIKSKDFIAAEEILKKLAKKEVIDPFEGKNSLRDIQTVFRDIYSKIPSVRELEKIVNNDAPSIKESEFTEIVNKTYGEISTLLNAEKGEIDSATIDAIYRGIYDLSIIKARTKFEIKESKDSKSKEEEQAVDGDKQDQQQDDAAPWEEQLEQYKPRNKPFSSDGGKGDDKILIETNAPLTSPLLGNHIFDMVTESRWSRAPVGRVNVYRDTKQRYSYKVHNYGQNNIPLPIPNGYRPVSLSPSVVIQEQSDGEYILVTNGGNPITELELIKQELVETIADKSRITKKYAISTGIDKNKWPTEILDLVTSIQKTIPDPLKQVEAISSYVKKNFNYYSDRLGKNKLQEADATVKEAKDRGDPDPVAFAKARTCQCEGAAWILSSLVRDFLNQPARIISGRTAVMRGDKAVVRKGDPKHAWIEVWIDGQGWVEVDATPAEREDKDKKNAAKDRPIGQKDDDGKEKGKENDTAKEEKGSAEKKAVKKVPGQNH